MQLFSWQLWCESVVIFFGVWVSASAVGSVGGTGDFSPERALLAALDDGKISCSVSSIIVFLEVSEINRTFIHLCRAGHQGTLFLQRRMGKIWNVALQIWLFFLKSEEPMSSAGRNSEVSAASSAPAGSAESCSVRGELGTNFESETSVARNPAEAQVFYTTDSEAAAGCDQEWWDPNAL